MWNLLFGKIIVFGNFINALREEGKFNKSLGAHGEIDF